MKRLFFFMVAVSILAAMTGCNVSNSISSDWSKANLTTVTNVMQSAAIPTSLKRLAVDNRLGAVHITGITNGTAGWTWKLTVSASDDSIAHQIANAVTCKARLDGDTLNLTVSMPDSDSGSTAQLMKEPHSLQSDFEIAVPESAAVQVQNRFGKVTLADLAGDVNAANKNGRLEIRDIAGGVSARTSFDVLTVSNTGPAALQNQNGEIQAADIHGSLEANTRFASLTAQEIQGAASLTNQNGSIRAISIVGSLNARTSFDSLIARHIAGPASLWNQNGRIEAIEVGGALKAGTSFDSLVARDIGGPTLLRDQNGNVKVTRLGGNANIETSFAELNAAGIQGDAVLKDRNGGVIANDITGSVKASTSFGAIDITGAGSNFVCNNRNGAIRLRATSAALKNIEAETSFAGMEVLLPADLKPAIQARTTFDRIDSDFPIENNSSSPEQLSEIANTPRISLQNRNGGIRVVRD